MKYYVSGVAVRTFTVTFTVVNPCESTSWTNPDEDITLPLYYVGEPGYTQTLPAF